MFLIDNAAVVFCLLALLAFGGGFFIGVVVGSAWKGDQKRKEWECQNR